MWADAQEKLENVAVQKLLGEVLLKPHGHPSLGVPSQEQVLGTLATSQTQFSLQPLMGYVLEQHITSLPCL